MEPPPHFPMTHLGAHCETLLGDSPDVRDAKYRLIPREHDPVSRSTTTVTPSSTSAMQQTPAHKGTVAVQSQEYAEDARGWKIPHDCSSEIGERV